MKTEQKKKPPFRMTPQRAGILRYLDGNKSHPSAEQVYRGVAGKYPGLSFATVYNTLQSLVSFGGLAEIKIDPARSRFDPCTLNHAHLMCVKCGAIADLEAPRKPPRPGRAPAGFRILRCNIEFYGVCPACGKKAGKKEKLSCRKKKEK